MTETAATREQREQVTEVLEALNARLRAGEPEVEIVAQLHQAGVDQAYAADMVQEARNITAKDLELLKGGPLDESRKKYMSQMVAGLGLIVAAALISTALYQLTDLGGSYVIYYGALAAGGISFLMGLYKYTLTY